MSFGKQQEVIFATIATTNFLPRAMVMAQSVKKYMPRSKIIICIVEEEIPKTSLNLYSYFDEIVLAKNIGIPDFYRFIFQYVQSEGSNACKAQFLIYLIETYRDYQKFIFLDADTKVFGPFTELLDLLENNEIIVSPHFISFNEQAPLYHLAVIHKTGIFNTGLFAIKRGADSDGFLHWWAKILSKYCITNPAKGFWNEQKWLDVASGLFNFRIQKDPGYNVGPWNLQERNFTVKEKGKYLVNKEPFRMFHFSSIYTDYLEDMLKLSSSEQRHIISRLKKEYLQEITNIDKDLLREKPWSYDFFSSGRPIQLKTRLNFRNNQKLYYHIKNPFFANNKTFRMKEKTNTMGIKINKRFT